MLFVKLVACALIVAATAAPQDILDLRSPRTLTPAPACVDEPGKSAVWCDHTKDIETRVKAIVGNLSADEKAELFVNGASSVNRINWPKYNW